MDDLLKTLNKEQLDVVLAIEGPVLVIAGPGSGKTRALTHKIAHLIKSGVVKEHEILAVTFTNKAAIEMKDRVEKILEKSLTSWIGTFHSISSRVLRIEAENIGIGKDFVIYDTDDSTKIIKEILKKMNLNPKEYSPNNILATISRAKNELITEGMFKSNSNSPFYAKVAEIYPMYQKRLKENNALDFSDLLYLTAKLLTENKEVLEKYQNRFKYILVDEYQDTNSVQYHLIKNLADKHKNLTVVGDVSQSIYSWRGADYRNMMQFQSDYPDSKVYKLARNYRSTEIIIKAAQSVIENNSTHIPLELYTENGKGQKVNIFEANDERAEARYITERIEEAVSPAGGYETFPDSKVDYSDFAVLYRTNAQSRIIEEAFVNAGIPYKMVGGVRFYDRMEIKDVLAYLKVFHNPKDTVSWARCINTPPRGIGKKTFGTISESNFDLELIKTKTNLDWSGMKDVPPLAAVDKVLKDFGYLAYLNDGTEESLSRIENIKEFRAVAGQYETIQDLLENIALVESSNRAIDKNKSAVTLMTLHAAKGLEFDTVFIAGMEEGIFPHSRSMADKAELEEERRICYVGITRAKRNIYLTYARSRSLYGQSGASMVSRFISDLPEEIIRFQFG